MPDRDIVADKAFQVQWTASPVVVEQCRILGVDVLSNGADQLVMKLKEFMRAEDKEHILDDGFVIKLRVYPANQEEMPEVE